MSSKKKKNQKRNPFNDDGNLETIKALFATAKKSFTCQICLKKFMSSNEIKRHFYREHKDKAKEVFPDFVDNEFMCYRCSPPQGCQDLNDLRGHLSLAHRLPPVPRSIPFQPIFPDNTFPFPRWYTQCYPCKLSFENRTKLFEHIKLEHMSVVGFHCDECHIGYKTRRELDEHLFVRHNNLIEEELAPVNPHPIQAFRLDGDKIIPIEGVEPAVILSASDPSKSYDGAGFMSDGNQTGNDILDDSNKQFSQNVVYQQQNSEPFNVLNSNMYLNGIQGADQKAVDLTYQMLNEEQQQSPLEESPSILYKCPFCPHLEPSEEQLGVHIKSHVNVEQPSQQANQEIMHISHICSMCNLGFTLEKDFNEHLLSHSSNQMSQGNFSQNLPQWKCGICSLDFSSEESFLDHNQRFHQLMNSQFATQINGQNVRIIKINSVKPSTSGHSDGGQLYVQPQKLQEFGLNVPEKLDNSSHLPLMEPQKMPNGLERQHLQANSSKSEQLRKCSVCNFRTYQMQILVNHLRKEHNIIARLQCPLCTNTYFDQKSLKRHYDKTHSTSGLKTCQ